MTKVGFVSLGCPKNLVDSEEMLGALAKAGCEIVSDKRHAEVIVINTCGFIESAKEESIDTILEMARLKREGACKSLIVVGCLAQRYGEELSREIPEIDALLGVGQAGNLPETLVLALSGQKVIDKSEPPEKWVENKGRIRSTQAWTAYLKISDGCDNRCSYCAIPDIRGRYRSRPVEYVIAEAEKLAGEGVKEIILIGQDTTRYGEDLGGVSLVSLLRELVKIDGPNWYRLMYSYPSRITSELIELVASEPKIANYFDIPFQHGDDRVLKRMNRRGSSAEYLQLAKRIRSICPDIALRTSIIVGFPGETKEEFENLIRFIDEIRFDRVGVFQYSREDIAPAAALPGQIESRTKGRRYDRLMRMQREISLKRNQAQIGREMDVLIEQVPQSEEGQAIGRSERDAPEIDGIVYVKKFRGQPGGVVSARIIAATEYDLIADAV
ncbi:MAG: 30S ribosomal protein S12 methylthiotransferase RimO [Armatimonadota bacterium]|nr:30S ribosomal protein S12 methylthiotransferase RimO [Armatimonadota bacterium]